MKKTGEGKLALVGLLAVIAIAGYFIFRQAGGQSSASPGVDWICEECDYAFTAPVRWNETIDCPRCPGQAVRVQIFYDTASGELIEIYRKKPVPPGYTHEIIGPEARLIKVPGGEWMMMLYHGDIPFKVERRENLIYAPPGSQYRK